MKLLSLELLHRSMLSLSPPTDMQNFRVKMGGVEFDCLFSTRGWPYSLALTARGDRLGFFLFPISDTYEVSNSMPNDTYLRLAGVLRTTGESGNELRPWKFFIEMDGLIPIIANPARTPSSRRMLELRIDILEERDRPYFSHWNPIGRKKRKDGSPAQVSEENKLKTLELLGREALAHSKINKISSSWSPVFVRDGWMPER